MADEASITPLKSRVTPLTIVAAFLSVAEIALTCAVVKVDGVVQIMLAIYIMVFTLCIAVAFFLILWKRPYVFYAPSEYGNVNPKEFMSAIRESPAVADQLQLAKTVEQNPDDLNARFRLIDAMADELESQCIIFMHESGKDMPVHTSCVYGYEGGIGGMGSMSSFRSTKMEGAGLAMKSGGGRYFSLTKLGHEFAHWLTEKGRKCKYFWSPGGGWGELTPGSVAEHMVQQAKENLEAGTPFQFSALESSIPEERKSGD